MGTKIKNCETHLTGASFSKLVTGWIQEFYQYLKIDISKFSIIENYLWTISKNGSWYILQFSADWQGVYSFTVSIKLENFHLSVYHIRILDFIFQFRSLMSYFNFENQFGMLNFYFQFPFWISIFKFNFTFLFNLTLHRKGNGNQNILQSHAECQCVHTLTVSIRLRNFQFPSINISYYNVKFSNLKFLFQS